MAAIGNSWTTVKQSWGVLRKDRELLLLPILSGLASAVVVASFVAPTWFSGLFDRAVTGNDPNAQGILVLAYLAMYLVLAFVTVYFTAALVSAANERLGGGDPTIGSALRGANAKLGKIFLWSIFAGTVSLILHMIENSTRQRNNLIGNIAARLAGVAWALATYFVIPVLLFEEQGVFGSLRRSGSLFKQRWGESVIGQYGIGAFFGALGFVVFLLTFLPAMYFLNGPAPNLAVAAIFIGLFVVAMLTVTVVGTALGGIYKTALYRFATQGQVAPGFEASVIEGAYRTR